MKCITMSRFAVFFTAGCIVLGGALRAEVIEQVLVKVNGEIFTKSDLEARQVEALRALGQQVDPKDKTLADAQLKKALDQVTPQVLVAVVDEMLLLQRGKDLGYKLTDEQFTSVVDSIKKDNNWTTDEQLKTALTGEKMTMADLRKNVEKSVIRDRVTQNEVLSKIGISDEEARKYYDTHMSEFTKPQQITLREILVAVPASNGAVNAAAEDAAKTKADGIRQRALNGDSYEKLAADFSNAPSSSNAGLIGPLNTNDISADLRKLLEQMKIGDITPPLRTAAGFQLLKLESRTDAEVTPFEKARDQISDKVFTGKRQEEYEKYLDKLRAQAIIDWKNQDIKKAYEQGLVTARAGTTAPPPVQ
jgi:parvulin-like peptidyl-prolyl isomerase